MRRLGAVAHTEAKGSACLNCGKGLTGQYCVACGQRADTGRIVLRSVLAELIANFTLLESPLPSTLRELTLAPGAAVARYVDGARARYTAPLKYALGGLALYVLALRWLDFAPLKISVTGPGSEADTAAALARAVEAARGGFELATLAALPLVALLQLALFRRSGRNYAEGLVLQLYLTGHLHLAGLLLTPLGLLNQRFFLGTRALLGLAYVAWASLDFFGGPPARTLLKAMALLLLQWVLVMLVTVFVVFPLLGVGGE